MSDSINNRDTNRLLIEHVAKAIKKAVEIPFGNILYAGTPMQGRLIYRDDAHKCECEMLDGDWEMVAREAIESVNSYKDSDHG